MVSSMEKEYTKVSLSSRIVNKLLKLLPYKSSTETEEAAKKYIKKISKKEFINKYELISVMNIDHKMPVYTYNGDLDNCEKSGFLLYIHGGSFIEKANRFQIEFAKKVALKSNSTLIFCDYPVAPYSDCLEMFSLFEKLYQIIISKNQTINFIGDSAGGGFAISFAKYVKDKGYKTPSKIITLSPWLDIAMEDDEIYDIAKYDNMCGVDGTKYMGKLWARDIDLKDSLVSPYYADVKDIGEITIITGGHDILKKQCKEFHEKLKKEKIAHNYIFYKDQGHIFGILPIKESKEVIKDIIKILDN